MKTSTRLDKSWQESGISQSSWRDLVNEIAELEELLLELHQQCDSLNALNRARLQQALDAKRQILRMNDIHGVLV